jgi:hypothetical protein
MKSPALWKSAVPDLDRSVAQTLGEPDQSGARAEEPAVADVLQHEAEPAGPNEGAQRGARRRRKQQHNPEEPPP